MRRVFRSVTTLSAVLLASSAAGILGCSSSDVVSPQSQLAGTYSLRTYNGQTLPVAVGVDSLGNMYAIVSDVYTFKTDGSFGEEYVLRQTPVTGAVNNQTYDDGGTWQLTGSTLTATYQDRSYVIGTFTNGNTITFSNGGSSVVFQK